jgi:hypothetical protein
VSLSGCILCDLTAEGRLPGLYLWCHDRSNWSQVTWRPSMAAAHNLEMRDGQWVPKPMEPTYIPCPLPGEVSSWVEWVEE